jgi:16S rRNA G527 N7-methylase RsmG
MFKKLRLLFQINSKCPALNEVDSIYNRAFSQLPVFIRKEYCERLIDKATYEMKQTQCQEEMKKIKLVIKAAQKEITTLNSL